MPAARNANGRHSGVSHERWLVSYADFITLLFAFFVVMFATSHADRQRAEVVAESIREALRSGSVGSVIKGLFGIEVVTPRVSPAKVTGQEEKPVAKATVVVVPALPSRFVEDLRPAMQLLSKELAEELRQEKLDLKLEPRGLIISLRQASFFPPGEDRLNPETYPVLERIARVIAQIDNPIRFEGHTDSQPISNSRFRDNWELSCARAIAVLHLFRDKFGLPERRMAVAGYADTHPVASNDTEEGRARNRRVDIVVLTREGLGLEPQQLLEELATQKGLPFQSQQDKQVEATPSGR